MTDAELDAVYTDLCKTMTRLGEQQAPLFLARLAMLALTALDRSDQAHRLIADAADDLKTVKAEP